MPSQPDMLGHVAKPFHNLEPFILRLVFERPAHAHGKIVCRRAGSHGRNIGKAITVPSKMKPRSKHFRAVVTATIMVCTRNAAHPSRRNHRAKHDRSGSTTASIKESTQPSKVNVFGCTADVSIRSFPSLSFVPATFSPFCQRCTTPGLTREFSGNSGLRSLCRNNFCIGKIIRARLFSPHLVEYFRLENLSIYILQFAFPNFCTAWKRCSQQTQRRISWTLSM